MPSKCVNVHTRGHTSLGLVIMRRHDSQRLFQERENLLPGSGVFHSLFSIDRQNFGSLFQTFLFSFISPPENWKDCLDLTWPNSNRDPWGDLYDITQNVLISAKTLLQAKFLFGAFTISQIQEHTNRMCACRVIFSQIWVTVGRWSLHKKRACHHERRRTSGRIVFSSRRHPPEDKTQMNFAKTHNGVANVMLPRCPWGSQALWTTGISPHINKDNPESGWR